MIPVIRACVEQRTNADYAGIVYQHIEAPETLHNAADHLRALFRLTHVHGKRFGLRPERTQPLGRSLRICLVQIRHHDRCPFARIAQSNRGTNAAPAAGNQRDNSFK